MKGKQGKTEVGEKFTEVIDVAVAGEEPFRNEARSVFKGIELLCITAEVKKYAPHVQEDREKQDVIGWFDPLTNQDHWRRPIKTQGGEDQNGIGN